MIDQISTYLHNPIVTIALYAGFNLLVDTMPEPKPDGGNGYLWLYRAMHGLAMNIKTARGLKMMVPQSGAAVIDIMNPTANQVQRTVVVASKSPLSGFGEKK